VTLRDFSLLRGGHFCLLASGVDNLTIDNLRLDTNRARLDIDSCHHVRIAKLHDQHAERRRHRAEERLRARLCPRTENVTIVNCQVSGFDFGTMLDGTYQRTQEFAPDKDRVTGRIKCGTESNGGFKNIRVANCVFERSAVSHSRRSMVATSKMSP